MRITHKSGGEGKPSLPKKILWFCPTFNGDVWIEYMLSYGHCMGLLASLEIDCEMFPIIGDSFIEKARNKAVAKFMSGDYDRLIMCDADQAFKTKTFYEMLTSGHEVTVACPPMKKSPMAFTTKTSDIKDGYFKTKQVGTGFIMFTRSVFEKMFEAYPELRNYDYDFNDKNGYSLFEFVKNGRVTGEDLTFCNRWVDIGGEIHVRADAPMRHKGFHAWEGNILDQMVPDDVKKINMELKEIMNSMRLQLA